METLVPSLSETAEHLADQMLANHWHVDRLGWNSLPLFPIPPETAERQVPRLVRFYKSVVAVQTRAEEIAVSIARRLLIGAENLQLELPFRRAISAVLNDEASHVATMITLEAMAEKAYPAIHRRPGESPLFAELMPAIETLEPTVAAIFMASYETSVAIRSYAEEQTYKVDSVLGSMAPRAAEDDGRHAKTLRVVARVFIDRFRAEHGDDPSGTSSVWKSKVYEPFWRYWSLMPAHEYFLAGEDSRQLTNVRKQVAHDVSIMRNILDYVGFSPEMQNAMRVDEINTML